MAFGSQADLENTADKKNVITPLKYRLVQMIPDHFMINLISNAHA